MQAQQLWRSVFPTTPGDVVQISETETHQEIAKDTSESGAEKLSVADTRGDALVYMDGVSAKGPYLLDMPPLSLNCRGTKGDFRRDEILMF